MKNAPTLADRILAFSFSKTWGWLDHDRVIQQLLPKANKFVLDDKMSAFMADLAWASTLTCAKSKVKTQRLLDGMRTLSRLPHKLTWIEFNNRARIARVDEVYGVDRGSYIFDTHREPDRIGWLIEQHPQVETAFRCTTFPYTPSKGHDDEDNLIPVGGTSMTWRSDDGPLPWTHPVDWTLPADVLRDGRIAAVLVGMFNYSSPQVGMCKPPCISVAANAAFIRINKRIAERENEDIDAVRCSLHKSELRYVWALLATINSLPIANKFVTASKGYVAKGRYRKFVDHTVVTLNVPETRYRRIAAHAIAVARRRAHEVRGHWRKDHWHPLTPMCDHQWVTVESHTVCSRCSGHRLWIPEHQRGDASLGFVTHDYDVRH